MKALMVVVELVWMEEVEVEEFQLPSLAPLSLVPPSLALPSPHHRNSMDSLNSILIQMKMMMMISSYPLASLVVLPAGLLVELEVV